MEMYTTVGITSFSMSSAPRTVPRQHSFLVCEHVNEGQFTVIISGRLNSNNAQDICSITRRALEGVTISVQQQVHKQGVGLHTSEYLHKGSC